MTVETRDLRQLSELRQIGAAEVIAEGDTTGATGTIGPFDPAEVQRRGRIYRSWGKRGVDLALVTFCAPVWVPLVAMLAFATLIDGGSPFYSQLRIGKGGQVFRLWKIRSMVRDADRLLAAHLAENPAARAEWNEMQKLSDDPRVTRLGLLMRMTSMDELPQLWNVLRGDMGLVGPRPIMVDQKEMYRSSAYYRLRPGLTGPWQVNARNGASFAERARFDAEYEANLSLGADVMLILRTFLVVLRATGR